MKNEEDIKIKDVELRVNIYTNINSIHKSLSFKL